MKATQQYLTRSLLSSLFFGVLALLITSTTSAQQLPDHTARIAEDIYSYGPTGDAQSMFIVTQEGVIAIESFNSEHSKGLVQAIRGVTKQPIKYLLHSHNHWDHASGGQVFKNAGATTMAHSEAYEWMAANTGQDMSVPDEKWEGTRKEITLGQTTIELHYLGMNHGLGMTFFFLPEQKVAYIADLVTPNRVLFTIVPDFNIGEWERSLENILAFDFDKAVYSHNQRPNPENGGIKQDVAEGLQFMRDLRGAIFEELQKGTNAMAVPGVVQLPAYQDWAMYDQWLAMNAWRVLLDVWMGPFPWRPDHAYQMNELKPTNLMTKNTGAIELFFL